MNAGRNCHLQAVDAVAQVCPNGSMFYALMEVGKYQMTENLHPVDKIIDLVFGASNLPIAPTGKIRTEVIFKNSLPAKLQFYFGHIPRRVDRIPGGQDGIRRFRVRMPETRELYPERHFRKIKMLNMHFHFNSWFFLHRFYEKLRSSLKRSNSLLGTKDLVDFGRVSYATVLPIIV